MSGVEEGNLVVPPAASLRPFGRAVKGIKLGWLLQDYALAFVLASR